MEKTLLPEFQKYMLSRKIIHESKVPFYAYWVSRFLYFSNGNNDLNQDLRVEGFLNRLKEQRDIADWQMRQAEEAVRLYISHFSKGTRESINADLSTGGNIYTEPGVVIEKVRKAIRLKHYSYKTERAYIDWIRPFPYKE